MRIKKTPRNSIFRRTGKVLRALVYLLSKVSSSDELSNVNTKIDSSRKNSLLKDAMGVVDKFGTDARSISRTLENIKDPEQVEKAVQTENVEKFVERNRQLKN